MPKAEWGAEPEFFGPRHAHREGRILRALGEAAGAAGPHLECAAGVGSLTLALARRGRRVVAADRSLRSLAETARCLRASGEARGTAMPVCVDITRLPFRDGAFASATSAETLEHIGDDGAAARELARVLHAGGTLVGTVPAGPGQWSAWDDWAGHERRYTADGMERLLRGAGLEPQVRVWGWPLVRLYDALFLGRVNRRRLESPGESTDDARLRAVAAAGRSRKLVALVTAVFVLDRLFDGVPWGVGLVFVARKPAGSAR
ncbi:MAG: methyltransferase domain-containing protein [Acidobacteriota bacterium]